MSVKLVIIVVVALLFLLILFMDKIRSFMARFFTVKATKEKYISELMNGVSGEDRYVKIEKLCRPLTAKDLAGKDLNYQIVFDLSVHRGLDFAVDTVNRASNSESLRQSIREDYISRLLNNTLRNGDADVFKKVCAPLTVKDFSDRALCKEYIYSMDRKLDTGFVVDIVMQATNSESLLQSILDDLTEDGYNKNKNDFDHVKAILKAAYRKGIRTQEIEAKQGTIVNLHKDNGMGCALHDDNWKAIEFKL